MKNTIINVKEDFDKQEKPVKKVGLSINEDKIKYTVSTRTERRDRIGQNMTLYPYNSERVHQFKYQETTITSVNDILQEINSQIQSVNSCWYGLQKIMESKNVSISTKIKI